MCGRYALNVTTSELIDAFDIQMGIPQVLPQLPADWNITPTKQIYLIRNSERDLRELATASWGIIAPWSKDDESALKSQSSAINARSETLDEKPTFKSAFRSRRCLIPADGYYEWATELGPYPTKQPFYISAKNQHPIAFAGIWDRWVSPSGRVVDSCAIITREAVDFLGEIHHRMPTFLPKNRWRDWLRKDLNSVSEIRSLMTLPSPATGLQAWPVSPRVNSIRNNGPELICEIDLGEPETLF